MLRLVRLDDRPAGAIATTGPPDRLDEKLVRPFRGSFVGEVQGDIRRDDPDESDGRHVEALGDEARSDEDVDPPVAEGIDDPLRGAAMLDDVAVEAADPKRRETVTDLAFDAFGAAAEIPDPGRAARGAAGRQWRRPAAVMATERRPCLVIDEWPLAVRAGLDVAAVAAHDDGGRPPAVQDEDRLVAVCSVERAERRRERARQQPALTRDKLGAEVDDLDGRCDTGRARRQDDVVVGAASGKANALDGRRRGPEDDCRSCQPAEPDRHVACLEPWRSVALVRRVVLFVDDDQPDVGEWRDDREPRPDDDVDIAGPDPAPLVGPFALAEAGVDESDPHRRGRPAADRRAASPCAISGTSTRAGRPASSAATIAST